MRSNRLLPVLVLCLAFLAWPLAALPVQAGCGLANNSFDEGFTDRFSDGHVVVPNGWEFWFQDGPDQVFGKNWRPSYGSFDAGYLGGKRVHGGSFSAKFGTSWATHNAGLYQRVAVPRYSQVTFSVWAMSWSSSGDDTGSVTSPGNYRLSVGIDPTGGTNWQAGTVRWSEPRIEYNTWIQLSISATSEADAVTVFLRGQPEFPVKHNESAWDDACLAVVPPTPRPTNPPPPTNTPKPTNTPTITPKPSATPTPKPSATPLPGNLCVQGFVDRNGNGVRDAGEDLLPETRFTVLDSKQAEVGDYLMVSAQEPYCFQGLAAGSYIVRVQGPAGYEPVGEKERSVAVQAGASQQVAFAHRQLPTPTPTARPTNTPRPTATPTLEPPSNALSIIGQGLYSVSGLIVALVALALPLGFRYLRMRE